ncbi:MAG: transglutaminase domain-containing protein [Treponema sp.]|nr:transglutaminase domain-containing protein [Treponema sp.]
MKRFLIVLCSLFVFSSGIFATELQIRAFPSFCFPFESSFSYAITQTFSLDLIPLTVHERDDIYFSGQGSFSFLNGSGFSLPFYEGGLALGYNFRIIDRLSVSAEAFANLYFVPDFSVDDNTYDGLSGLSFGGRLFANYYISPSFAASLFGAYKYYMYKPEPFLSSIEAGIGITYNFSKGIFGATNVELNDYQTQSIFPIFYSRYDDHEFGSVTFVNEEKNDITDVVITLFIESYMSNPETIAKYDLIKRGQEFSAEFKAFLNENILDLLQAQLATAKIEVSYSSLGKKMSLVQNVDLQTLTRNSMTWEDDRRAAAFVSGRDASAQLFARQIEAIIKNQLDPNLPVNFQYAAAVFAAIKAYGVNYVVDPSSAFTDNVGTSSVDFLQFPYQTLLYHGGDCDDLSILNCSLLQAMGIETAFVTVPGHIYMAFDSGLPVDQAGKINRGRTIVYDDKVWIPVEITVMQDTFALALQIGYKEWKKYEDQAAVIPISKAWEEYSPVSVPESDAGIKMPEKSEIIKEFKAALKAVR